MKKRVLSVLLALVMSLGLMPTAGAAGEFEIQNGRLTKYTGPGGDVVIPSSVKEIGMLAFVDCANMTSITIPDSVTTIDTSAFIRCTGLTSLTIPASVTKVGCDMFWGSSNLAEIIVDPANQYVASVDGVLYTKDLTLLCAYPPAKTGVYRVPDGVKRIFDSAFRGTAVTGVIIPESVTEIDMLAFDHCTSLTSLTIMDGVKTIGACAFRNCTSLARVELPKSVGSLGNSPFEACTSLASIEVDPESNYYASVDGVLYTRDMKKLIAYPSGGDAVYHIPDTVTSIKNCALVGCTSLTSVTIPGGLTDIGKSAFSGCPALTKIVVDPSNSKYADADGVLYSKDFETLIAYPGGKGTSYAVPEGVTSIEEYAFAETEALIDVAMPNSVTKIGEFAFNGCTNLASISVSGAITSIGAYAFQGCQNLRDIYYPNTESAWKRIEIESGSSYYLNEATVHFNSPLPENIPPRPVPTQAAVDEAPTPDTSAQATATPTVSTVLVNGEKQSFDAYNINGNNYFKLRDLACVLSGTEKQFEVGWDGAANAISLTSGQPYTPAGGEMAAGNAKSQTATPTTSKILVDGKEVSLTAYNIGGNNYFKLRDVGETFDFGVGWDGASQTITIDTSTGYTAG